MPIGFDYTPAAAVASLAWMAGEGEARRYRDQRAFQQQEMAQQDLQQQRSLAFQAAQQERGQMYDAHRQAQQLAAQQAGQYAGFAFSAEQHMFDAAQRQQLQEQAQKAAIIERENAARYGAMGHLMHDITALEKEGFLYTPDQDKEIRKLEADLETTKSDPSYNEDHRRSAYLQYIEQRSRIRPKAPPPKPPQEVFEQSLVKMQHPETGEIVFGMLGERNGAPQFNPIKFAGEALRVKEQQAQAKIAEQQQKAQAAAELREARTQQVAVNAMHSDYRNFIKDTSKLKDDLRNAIAKLPSDKEAIEDGLQNYSRDAIAQQLAAEAVRQEQALRRAYVLQHGKVAQVHDPELAAEFGLAPVGHGWSANPEQFTQQMLQQRDEPGMAGFDGAMATAPGFGYRDPQNGGDAGWQPFMQPPGPPQLPPEVEQQASERVLSAAPAARMKLKLLESKYGGRPPASAPDEQALYDAMQRIVDEAARMAPSQAAPAPAAPVAPAAQPTRGNPPAYKPQSGLESLGF